MEKLLYNIKELQRVVGIGRNKIYELIRQGKFPKPIKIGTKSLWKKSDVEKWVKSLSEHV